MGKTVWKPGTLLYPLPVVMVSLGDIEGISNIITVAWTGTVNSDPAMTYISVRPERYSYEILKKTGEFVINLTTENLAKACDYCGVRSGREVDKFQALSLTKAPSSSLKKAPIIYESPVNIECEVKEILPLGSHDMFLAQVKAVCVSEEYLDKNGKFHFNDSRPVCYSHGQYMSLGKTLGTFGYSVKKQEPAKKRVHKKGK